MSTLRRLIASLALAGLLLTALGPAAAGHDGSRRSARWADPSRFDLRAALHCQRGALRPHRTPVLLLTGVAITGGELWTRGFQDSLAASGHKSCYIDFPDYAFGDMQVSAEYVAYAIGRMSRGSTRQVAIYGYSLGAILPRLALALRPDLRAEVTDVVAVAGAQHGIVGFLACGSPPCLPAVWQTTAGSDLLRALNSQGDETPAPVDWTTVRSTTDGVVTPVDTAVLDGAANILVQDMCPGRQTTHLEMPFDSVSFASLLDALANTGPADPSRLPSDTCDAPYAPGLDTTQVARDVAEYNTVAPGRIFGQEVPTVPAEPPVRQLRS